jgi:DNA-binding NtrC family response regulator
MNVLIVESRKELALIWARHLERQGCAVRIAHRQEDAITLLQDHSFEVVVLDLVLDQGSALAISDFANFRQPDAQVIFVTNSAFFSDGSIFQHCSNACAFLPSTTPPRDLATMVHHYGRANRPEPPAWRQAAGN